MHDITQNVLNKAKHHSNATEITKIEAMSSNKTIKDKGAIALQWKSNVYRIAALFRIVVLFEEIAKIWDHIIIGKKDPSWYTFIR